MTNVQLRSVTKSYGDFKAADAIDLDIADGEFLVLLGPSGCGKTTTLRMVAGFVEPTSGTIRIGESDVTNLPPWKRSTGLVFQSYALFPHLTVAQNVAFGLEMRKVPKAEIADKVMAAVQMVRLDHLLERYPRQLSGGQQQRVALARALAFRPDVLLLDEPLSNLDAKLRHEVRVEIRNLQQRLGITTVMVTHDQEEALTMADRLVVMSEGRIQQVGNQRDLYDRPQSRFVASFVGRSSFLEGNVSSSRFVTAGGLSVAVDSRLDGKAELALRPERISVARTPFEGAANNFAGHVEFVSFMGSAIDVHVQLNDTDRVIAQIVNYDNEAPPALNEKVFVSWPPSASVFLK